MNGPVGSTQGEDKIEAWPVGPGQAEQSATLNSQPTGRGVVCRSADDGWVDQASVRPRRKGWTSTWLGREVGCEQAGPTGCQEGQPRKAIAWLRKRRSMDRTKTPGVLGWG